MLKVLSVSVVLCLLPILVVEGSEETVKAKDWGCQILAVYKEDDSRLHAGCTVKYPAFICGGYCKSEHLPSAEQKNKGTDSEPLYQISMKKDCSCCQPSSWSDEVTINATMVVCGGEKRTDLTEAITFLFPTDCYCVSCIPQPGL